MPLKLQVNALYFNFIWTVILFMFYNSSPTGTSEPGERKLLLKFDVKCKISKPRLKSTLHYVTF